MLNSASDLVFQVMLNLKGCPENAAMQSLRTAFRRLCQETGCWRSSFTLTLSADPAVEPDRRLAVDIKNLAADAYISKVRRLFIQKANGDGTFGDSGRVWPGGYGIEMRSTGPVLLLAAGSGVENGDKLTLDLEMYPAEMGDTGIPAAILGLCGEAAVLLASLTLAQQPGRPWTSVQSEISLHGRYLDAKRNLLHALGTSQADTGEAERMRIVEG